MKNIVRQIAQYLRVYKRLISMNFSVVLAFRASFLMGVLSTVMWFGLNIIQVYILTYRSGRVFGWTQHELLILTATFNLLIGIFHTLFSRNFARFSELIHYGQLDGLLVKPVDSQFLISLWHVRYPNIFRSLFSGLFLIYLLISAKMVITASQIFGFFVLLLFGLTLMYSIWFIVSTLIIWHTKLTNLIDLLYFVNHISRYPRDMFAGIPGPIYALLFPLMFMVIAPMKALIGTVLMGDVFWLVLFSGVLFIISRVFWRYALRSYTSAAG